VAAVVAVEPSTYPAVVVDDASADTVVGMVTADGDESLVALSPSSSAEQADSAITQATEARRGRDMRFSVPQCTLVRRSPRLG
jgi:hypothetical protein